MKSTRPEAIEALTRAVNDREPALQVAAIQALAAIGPPARSAIPAIAEGLATADARVRSAAATGLAAFGSESAPYVEVLGNGTADADEKVRRAAGNAMLTIVAAPSQSTAPLETKLDLVSPDHSAISAAPCRANTLLVTTLELVNHDRPVTSLEMPPAPPAPLPASATQSSVPMGALAAATAEPLSHPAARGPDLNISTGEHDGPGARDFPEPAKQTGQIAPAPGALSAPSPAVPTPLDTASVNAGNSVCQPAPSAATAALTVPDVSPLPMHKEIIMAPTQLQALNTAGWKPAVPDRPIEQAPAESVKPDGASFPSKPIEAAFSAGGDYTQFNPPIHLPRGVIAMSSSAVPTLPHAPDSAPSSGSPTTWQTYKPAITDSAIAVYRPLPPGPPIISSQAYALDPSRVIAASSPYAR
jgi:hypothetical protein